MKLVIPESTREAQKATCTTVDTIQITPDLVARWKSPPFQRPLRVNEKVRTLAQKIKEEGGVIPGVITIGVLNREKYLLDGQHRREAFLLSECQEGYVDIRLHHFDDMGEMGEEFVRLNSALVRLRPDDILRGLEGSNEHLQRLRKKCPYVGYDMIRRSTASPLVSMSTVLRCWYGSANEVPNPSGTSALNTVAGLTQQNTDELIAFLDAAHGAWGRDTEYQKLWGSLNLTLTMWLYRRTVIEPYTSQTPKLTKDQYTKCLMTLSASGHYLDWLVGRILSERDRTPAYARIKMLFARRIEQDTGKKPRLPNPAWGNHGTSNAKV